MHHRVDVAVANHLGYEGITDVGANELGPSHPAQHVLAGRDRIYRDDPLDQRVLRQSGSQVAAKKPARTSNQHHFGVVHGVVRVVAGSGAAPARRIHPNSLTAEMGRSAMAARWSARSGV